MKKCIKCGEKIEDNFMHCPWCGKKQASSKAPPAKKKKRPNGYGGVSMLKGARKRPFVARVWDGQKQAVLGTYETETKATEAISEWRKLNITAERYNITLGQLYEQLLKKTKVGESGLEHYSSAWLRLSALGDRPVRELVTIDFEQLIENAKKVPRYKVLAKVEIEKLRPAAKQRYEKLVAQPLEPLGRDSKLQIKNLASILCKMAMAMKLMDKNYAELVKIDSEARKEKRNLSKQDIEKLFAHTEDETVMIILMYLYSGFRVNELLKMKKTEVDTEKWWFIGGSKTDAGRDRIVPILPCIRPYVQHFYDRRGDFLITNGKGHKINYRHFLDAMFYPTLDRLQIERQNEAGENILTPHRTRHTITQLAVAAGVAPEALKAILGHSKYETTINYYDDKADPEFLVSEFEKIEEEGSGKEPQTS